MRNPQLAVITGVAIVAWLGPMAAPAAAHISPDKYEITAGASGTITLSVPHGCDGSPTTAIAVQMPDGFVSVSPHVKPGWGITTESEPLNPPVEDEEGAQITERVSVVTFTGGPLPAEFTDTFTIGFQAPDTPGEMAYFKLVQTCEQGETGWIEEWDGEGEEPEHPAPAARIVAAENGGDEHAEGAEESTDGGGDTSRADDDTSSTLSVIALVTAIAGLLVGGSALVLARRGT